MQACACECVRVRACACVRVQACACVCVRACACVCMCACVRACVTLVIEGVDSDDGAVGSGDEAKHVLDTRRCLV